LQRFKNTNKLIGKFNGDEDDQELIYAVDNKISNWLHDTQTTRRQWLVNSAMSRGRQWSVLRDTEDKLVSLVPPPGRKQITDDMITPAKKHYIANMIVATPRFKAVPDNLLDSSSITAARFGSALLAHYWDTWKFVLDYIELLGYVHDFGSCFAYINVEPVQQSYTAIDAITGEAVEDEDSNVIAAQDTINDLTCTILPPQCVITTLDTVSVTKKDWVIIYQNRPLDYFKETYKNGNEVVDEAEDSRDNYKLSLLSRRDNTNTSRVESANEWIYLQRPSDKNPDGLVLCGAGKVLLIPKDQKKARQKWPYKKLTINPIVQFHDVKDPGEFYPRAQMESVIPLQKALNLVWSSIVENAEDMCHIKWLIHTSALPMEEDIDDMPSVVRWSGSQMPQQASPAGLPQYVFNIITMLKAAIEDKQNYHAASQGDTAGSMRSNAQQVNSQQQDQMPLTIKDEIFTAKFEEMGEIILGIAAEALTDERLITYTGENRRTMVEKFKAEMLGNVRKVKVKLTNMHLRSRSAVTQNIVTMFQYGMFTDQFGRPDGMKALEKLEWAIPDSEFDEIKMHTEVAHLENDKMADNEFTPVLPQQNHKVHLNVHYRYMNSPDFMKIYEDAKFDQNQKKIVYTDPANEEIANNFTEHISVHLQIYMQSLAMLQPPPEQQGEQTKTKSKAKSK